MKLKIEITMDNAAFVPAPGIEVARILRQVAESLDHEYAYSVGMYGATLRDYNGNTVGKAAVTGK
jgi:hypothetical protein